MGITEIGRSGTALLLAGTGSPVRFGAIGSGVTAFTTGQSGLVNEVARNFIAGSADTSIVKKVTYTTFYPSTQITGATPISEVGMFVGSVGTGQEFEMFNREVFSSFTKDDTIELTYEQTYEIF